MPVPAEPVPGSGGTCSGRRGGASRCPAKRAGASPPDRVPRPSFASVVKETTPPRSVTDHWTTDLTEILESQPNPIRQILFSQKERGLLSPKKSFHPDLSFFPPATASRDRISLFSWRAQAFPGRILHETRTPLTCSPDNRFFPAANKSLSRGKRPFEQRHKSFE